MDQTRGLKRVDNKNSEHEIVCKYCGDALELDGHYLSKITGLYTCLSNPSRIKSHIPNFLSND